MIFLKLEAPSTFLYNNSYYSVKILSPWKLHLLLYLCVSHFNRRIRRATMQRSIVITQHCKRCQNPGLQFVSLLSTKKTLMMLLRIHDWMFAFCRDDSFLLSVLSPALSDAVEEGVYLHTSALTCFINKDYASEDGMFVVPWCCWTQLGNQQRQHCWTRPLHPDCLA